MQSKSLLKNIFTFIKNPHYRADNIDEGLLRKVFSLIRIIALQVFTAALVGLPVGLLLQLLGYDIGNHSIVRATTSGSFLVLIILGVFIAPLTEELTFRLVLRFSYFKLSLSFAFIILTFIDIALKYMPFQLPEWFLSMSSLQGILFYLGTVVFLSFIIYLIFKRFFKLEAIIEFYTKHFKIIFYFTILIFGLVHITNYSELGAFVFLTPLLVLPQILVAIFLSYVRVHYGLKWSIFNHALYNALLFIPYGILLLGSENLTKISNNQDASALYDLSNRDLFVLGTLVFIVILAILIILGLLLQMIIELFLNESTKGK